MRDLRLYLNSNLVFEGVVDKGCGNQVFDYGCVIHVTESNSSVCEVLQAVPSAMDNVSLFQSADYSTPNTVRSETHPSSRDLRSETPHPSSRDLPVVDISPDNQHGEQTSTQGDRPTGEGDSIITIFSTNSSIIHESNQNSRYQKLSYYRLIN